MCQVDVVKFSKITVDAHFFVKKRRDIRIEDVSIIRVRSIFREELCGMLKKLFLIIMIGLLLQPNIYLANASTLEKTTVLNEQEQQEVENKDESQAETSLTVSNKAEKPSTRAIEDINEYQWSKDGFDIYARPNLNAEYSQDITFQTNNATLGSKVGDTLEGYVDLPLTAIVKYKGATMFYGDKFMSDKVSAYHNNVEFDFNLKESDLSSFEIKVVKIDFPDNNRPSIPSSSTGGAIGNNGKFYIQIKRLKKTTGKELEIPTILKWNTSYVLQNGIMQHYIRNWQNYSTNKTYKIALEMEPIIETKDSVLYSTQSYNPENNFVGGTDIDGNSLKWDEKTMKVTGDVVDMAKPGDYKQRLTYTYVFQGENKTVTSDYVVTVKEDKTAIKAIATTYYQGDTFDFKNGFSGAWDKDGNELPFNDDLAWYGSPPVDMNVPGKYSVFYGLRNANGKLTYTSKTVTVLEDQSSLKTKSSTIYVGEPWDKKANFVSATDIYGETVGWASSAISTNGFRVDTSKPGTHKITYTYKGKFKSVDSTFTIDVIEKPLEISVPEVVDFGKYSLGTSRPKLYWDDKNTIRITDNAKKGWELSVQVKTNTDFSNYVYHKKQLVGTERIVIDEGKGNKVVSEELLDEELIYIDYTDAKSLRTDHATFEWNITPSIKGVSE